MSPEYQAALTALRLEAKLFNTVAETYRAKLCDDATYLAARKLYLKAHEMFDEAEAAEDLRVGK